MNFDKIKRVPLVLFSIYFLKLLSISSPTLVDGVILLVLGLAAGFYEAWSQISEMKALNAKFQALEDKLVAIEKGNQDLKNYVSSLKLGQQIKMGMNGR